MVMNINSIFSVVKQNQIDWHFDGSKPTRLHGVKNGYERNMYECILFIKDFDNLLNSGLFQERELSRMLGNSSLEIATLLYSAGEDNEKWRWWCYHSGICMMLASDYLYGIQLVSISRNYNLFGDEKEMIENTKCSNFREEVIKWLFFLKNPDCYPKKEPKDELDVLYKNLVDSIGVRDSERIDKNIYAIVEYWIEETGNIKYEEGRSPVFEPEINSVVANLIRTGYHPKIERKNILKFLQAALEE